MVTLRMFSLPPLVPAAKEGLDTRRGGGANWKLGDNISDE